MKLELVPEDEEVLKNDRTYQKKKKKPNQNKTNREDNFDGLLYARLGASGALK